MPIKISILFFVLSSVTVGDAFAADVVIGDEEPQVRMVQYKKDKRADQFQPLSGLVCRCDEDGDFQMNMQMDGFGDGDKRSQAPVIDLRYANSKGKMVRENFPGVDPKIAKVKDPAKVDVKNRKGNLSVHFQKLQKGAHLFVLNLDWSERVLEIIGDSYEQLKSVTGEIQLPGFKKKHRVSCEQSF